MNETSFFMKKLAFVSSKLLQIFLPCYFGSKVAKASKKIQTSVFHSAWVGSSREYASAVKIFMENSKKSSEISTTYGLFAIDFGTFTRICNSAYSLFALFQKVNQK